MIRTRYHAVLRVASPDWPTQPKTHFIERARCANRHGGHLPSKSNTAPRPAEASSRPSPLRGGRVASISPGRPPPGPRSSKRRPCQPPSPGKLRSHAVFCRASSLGSPQPLSPSLTDSRSPPCPGFVAPWPFRKPPRLPVAGADRQSSSSSLNPWQRRLSSYRRDRCGPCLNALCLLRWLR